MDRLIVYPGQIPLDTDELVTNKNAMVALAMLSQATLGTSQVVDGLACTPTTPASMSILVGAGSIYSLVALDANAYGSLPADNANSVVKQGVNISPATLTLTAPGTVGFSQNYLIQASFVETDDTPVVLPYYNAAQPNVAYSGPNGSGTSQNTRRHAVVNLGAKAGVAAASGSQTTPSPDAGFVGLYVVTVAFGATSVTAGNITQNSTAPFFTKLPVVPASVQNGAWVYAVAGGTANALTATLTPTPAGYTAGMQVLLKASTRNTGAATLSLNGLSSQPITKADGSALQAGDFAPGYIAELVYDGSKFQLSTPSGAAQHSTATFTTAGTSSWTVPTGVQWIYAEVIGGGGGGGGCQGSTTAQTVSGAGGGAGEYRAGWINVGGVASVSVTVGAGGTAGVGATGAGIGGNSSFGSFVTANGGQGGQRTTAQNTPGGDGGSGGSGGTVTLAGGNGSDGQCSAWVGFGNGAPGPYGGAGRAANSGGIQATGKAAGAGAGGSYDAALTNTAYTGGVGAAGGVFLYY